MLFCSCLRPLCIQAPFTLASSQAQPCISILHQRSVGCSCISLCICLFCLCFCLRPLCIQSPFTPASSPLHLKRQNASQASREHAAAALKAKNLQIYPLQDANMFVRASREQIFMAEINSGFNKWHASLQTVLRHRNVFPIFFKLQHRKKIPSVLFCFTILLIFGLLNLSNL